MAGVLVTQIQHQFSAADGSVRALAQLRAYLTGTTTPTPIYSDAAMLSTITQPMTADSAGIFAEFYLNPAIQTRIKVIVAGGDFNNPLLDVDPVNEASADIDEDDIADGAIEAKLGYTPVADDGTVSFTAPQRYQFSPTPTVFHEDDLGYMGAPPETHNENFTIALDDTGKMIKKTDTTAYAWTIPLNATTAFPIGHGVWMVNAGTAGAITITRAGGVTLTAAGSVTDENKTLNPGGMVYVMKIAADIWKLTGALG